MTQLMYDSITAADIPADAKIVAGYVDGRFAWSAADWARFPDAVKVTITVLGLTLEADVIDVETGDATPADAAVWIRKRLAAGVTTRPTVYCSASAMEAVNKACVWLDYDIWSASYNLPGTPPRPHIDPGAVATQYTDPAGGSGGHYDLTLCQDNWPQGDLEVALPPIDPVLVQQFSLAGPQDYVGLVANYQGVCATYAAQVSDLQSQLVAAQAKPADCSAIQAQLTQLQAQVAKAVSDLGTAG